MFSVKKAAASVLIILVDAFDVCKVLNNFFNFVAHFFNSIRTVSLFHSITVERRLSQISKTRGGSDH